MDFFEHQDQARRQTRTLVLLFILAVVAIVIAVNVVAALIWLWMQGERLYGEQIYPPGFFLANTLITVGLIGGGTLVEIFNLREGGEAVAQMAGGRLVSTATKDLQEKRLLNVVEEMAIASGIACPKVYVLDGEEAINAFAAGYNPNEAVVAVTQGTLRRLTRDELQGVIGHEFSHILNGDMRLNVRLIGVLFGIQMIASFGSHLLDFASRSSGSRSRSDKGPSPQAIMFVMGIALLVIGYIGVFFGRLIKAAVSRQREFLADASAVQFTRNPEGIGNALAKIGGLAKKSKDAGRIHHPNAEQLSHMFLSAVKPSLLSGLFATHPPIPERLRRIFGRSVDLRDAPELPEEYAAAEPPLPDLPFAASGFAEASAAPAISSAVPTDLSAGLSLAFGRSVARQTRLSPELDSALHDPYRACAVVYALLIETDVKPNPKIPVLQQEVPKQAAIVTYLVDVIDQLPRSARLPLLDLVMPALRQLPQSERDRMLDVVAKEIAADNKVSLAEFVMQTVLDRRLAAHAGRATRVRFHHLRGVKIECAILLSLVAHVATLDTRQTRKDAPLQAFLRGAAAIGEVGLTAADLLPANDIGFAKVRVALDRANQLAPLLKPVLIKALLAAAEGGAGGMLSIQTADVLRALCAGLEAPMPPAVTAAYADCQLPQKAVEGA